MKRLLLLSALFLVTLSAIFYFSQKQKAPSGKPSPAVTAATNPAPPYFQQLQKKASAGRQYARQNGLSTELAFLLDMRLPSGRNRFFVYDFIQDTISAVALVSHGSCNTAFQPEPVFSNEPGGGCSSLGRYKIGKAYMGSFGKAYKLHGLDSSNSNAYQRYVVLHGYSAVPEKETEPFPIVNSLGCPMVTYAFLNKLSALIETQEKPVMLWIYQ
ncbi:MAG: peptidase [Sphingobacteriales bacterium]|nr:MAG: peptidase [Sphingobacteriales bacterium]